MTRRFLNLFVLALTGWLAAPGTRGADTRNPAPDFKEVYDLLRTNLTGVSDENLNRAAVQGLVSQFPGKVSLVNGVADGAAIPQDGAALTKSAILENNVVYLRVGRVAGNLADELSTAYRALTATNKVVGIVLDLRFAGGDDFTAAQATGKLFAAKKFISEPLVVLVNGETRGTAAALAASLRRSGTGLILGNPTGNQAMTFKEFTLSNGERLRIATAPPNSGGGAASTASGIQPDIAVAVNADDERAFLDNPYGTSAQNNISSKAASNSFLPFVDHTSEADLVQQKQHDGKILGTTEFHERDTDLSGPGGDNTDEASPPARAVEPQKPVIRDPVLARAVDLIKSLAVVRKPRP